MTSNAFKQRIYKFWAILSENGMGPTAKFLISRMRGDKSAQFLKFKGHQIWIRPRTPDLSVAYECFGDEYKKLREIIPRDAEGCIVDAGGYIGTAALALSESFPKCKIVTIEPNKENFKLLTWNVTSNEMITPINAALVPNSWSGRIDLVDPNCGEWGYKIRPGDENQADASNGLDAITMDDILALSGCGHILVLKMDIEGVEWELLKCSSSWLNKVDALFVELHSHLHEDIESVYQNSCEGRYEAPVSGEKRLSVIKPLVC